MSDKDNLTLGIQAAKNGDTGKAKDYLANVVRENPRSEEGWLWLGRCLQDQEQRKHCFERALQLNPQNVEAQQELDNLFLSIAVDRSNTLPASSKDIPISSEEKSREDNWISNPLFLRIMGIIAGLCVCGIPILFVINSGLLDPLTGSLPGKAPRASPTTVSFSVPSASPTIWNAATFISATASPSVVVNINTWQARDLIAQGKHAEAIILLDQLIQSAPKADEAYFLRAISYQNLMGQQRSMFEFQDYLDRGLADIDKAIALRPDNGDYYMLRRKLLVDLASMQNFRADSVRVAEYALENIGAAISLGSTLEEYPDRLYLIDLIYSNQCEVALQRTLEMIDRTDPNDQSIGGLYHIQSQAHICLGEADKAIKLVDKSMFNDINMEWKRELKARYLYQAGRSDEALQLLDELIEQRPSYDGWRYYLRALIYQEMGQMDKAEEDLMMGAGNTWSRVGLYSYVLGRMALEDGNNEEGIVLLQEAEATLEIVFAPLQERIRTELERLGASPLEIDPSVLLDATPIPTIQPKPTARALPTSTANLLVTPTSTPGISLPNNVDDAVIVDLATGTGKLTLLPNDYPLLRFQPAEPIPIKQIKSLVVRLIPEMQESINPDIQIYFWVPTGGGWRYIAPTWGDNPIEQPGDYPLPEGDIFLAIRNWGAKTVVFDNVTLILIVETQDGAIKTYGPR